MPPPPFPGWLGPIAGAGLGALFAWGLARGEGEDVSTQRLVYGAILGAVAGVIVWVWDVLKRRGKDGQ